MPRGPRLHYKGSHATTSAYLRAAYYADPTTRCARCGRTLYEHPPTKTGKAPTWEAGHVVDGQVGGPYQPEVKSCNASAGASAGNRRRKPRRRSRLAW